ncbi:tetratricopeptide repeat protein [Mucilaginibacter psychrotolerans]|uniref:Tetratricopeptide repeat protein n=1 Tax=Mucilaginibacter psychrotolerans TaxID=1524096 RepID=A0A4Y8SNS4_9SPHI|nr:tetratricopeptide repeat protein [Mucilaginibacter psychrotolerans]TFF40104.1 tetratricopeptide repeat protein [Mucilaginibacter psychrotolerans]
MNKKQIAVCAIVVLTMGYLYMQPVKGLVKAQDAGSKPAAAADAAQPATEVTLASVEEIARPALSAQQAQQVSTLEEKLKTASDADKANLQLEIAALWDAARQPAPAAFYYQDVAQRTSKFDDWVNAGNRFNEATRASQDAQAQQGLSAKAATAFTNATKQKPNDLEAKTGLGVAYVNGGGMPMQGIALLLDVVKQDPKNHSALLNLGMFAMKSGQYDKAVARFKTMIAIKEELEPYFYLAESYKQLGQKKEAIAAYEKCKELIGDPVEAQRIDEFIKELKK